MVYYWPHIVPMQSSLPSFDLMVFSLSKLTGMAQSRLGWALIRDQSLAFGTIGPSSIETYGVSAESQFRGARIMAHLALDQSAYFGILYGQITARWTQLQNMFQQAASNRFQLQSTQGFWVWIACLLPTDDCNQVFLDAGIKGRFGAGETGVSGHIRLSVMGRPSAWNVLSGRIQILLNQQTERSTQQRQTEARIELN